MEGKLSYWLEAELSESVPKSQAEALEKRIVEMKSKLAESSAELAAAKARVKELEFAMAKPKEETPSEAPTG